MKFRNSKGQFTKGIIPKNKTNVYVKCLNCGKDFRVVPNKLKNGRGKYCSKDCFYSSAETKKRMTGNNNNKWKGNDVGYLGIHAWIINHLGQPTKCEHCGKDNLIKQQIHWANKDHLYKRNLDDWIRLCASCHRKYDLLNN